MILSYCILTYFVDLHPNGAEGIQISYLLESELKEGPVGQDDNYGFKREIH